MENQCWLKAQLGLDTPCGEMPWDLAHIGLSEHFLHKAPNGPKLSKADANDTRLIRAVCRPHHHALDVARSARLTRLDIPDSVEEFAEQHGVAWRLTRDYGEREETA